MTCPDWRTRLKKASFRGARFFVESDEIAGGRRNVVHEFPHRDTPYVEDLGRKAVKVQITGYLASAVADTEARRLKAACESAGAATLILPTDGGRRAHCESFSRSFDKDKHGYIAFQMEFVEAGAGGGPYPSQLLGRLAEATAVAMAGSVEQMFARRFNALGVAAFVVDAAARDIRNAAATLDDLRARTRLDSGKSAGLAVAAADMHRDAAVLAAAGDSGDRYAGLSFMAAGESAKPALPERVAQFFETFRGAGDVEATAQAFAQVLNYGDDFARIARITASRAREDDNRGAISALVRQSAFAAWCAATVNRTFADRREAIQARADAAEFADAEMERLRGWEAHAVWRDVWTLQGQMAEYLSRLIADLAPVVFIGAPKSMPSLYWAGRLYDDAARAAEVAARNRVKHPSFMPAEFEALSR
ncbi:MAG: DNA circularization N-terminal domain-containing protein [Hyphomicrobiales bacterium]|nr:DNA circularization N-terminal domain-containing protein [Hyphomicrobiales bacterium]